MTMEGEFSKYLEDHYSEPPVEREALTDECEILVIGAGFAGLLLWYRLKQAGFNDVRFCEKGGDVGGTWYWNRYPVLLVTSSPTATSLGGNGIFPNYEVCLRLRNSRVLPNYGDQVWFLRQMPLPYDRRNNRVG